MNKKTIILIIIGFILTILITIGITLVVTKNNEAKKLNRININENESKKEETNKAENTGTDIEEEPATEENNVSSKNNVIKDQSSAKNNGSQTAQPTIPTEENKKSEADVVKYVENISLESTGNKLKTGFVTTIDFLFYGGEIYGKTFSELSNSAKIKIITLALKIDSKIDEYFPGYKESISTTTNKVYTNIKTKLVTLYLDTTVKICNNNPTLCEDAKQGLTELKQDFGLTWDFIKDISGVGFSKLKDWYEVWREE